MNWEDIAQQKTQNLLRHWQKLGTFRHDNLAVGAGIHKQHSEKPYVFSRSHTVNGKADQVLVALEEKKGLKTVPVYGVFPNGSQVKDYYSNQLITVNNNEVNFSSPFNIVLLAPINH
jgi:alpha-amylase